MDVTYSLICLYDSVSCYDDVYSYVMTDVHKRDWLKSSHVTSTFIKLCLSVINNNNNSNNVTTISKAP